MPGILRRDHPAVALRADGNAAARAAVGHARRFRPTLVYERYALGSAAGASVRRALSVPWVLEVNASRAWEAAWADAVPASGALLRREIRTFAAADLLVAVSEPLADWIAAHGIPRERILVCPNGADGPAATAPLADDAPGSSGAAVPPAAERVDPAGPFVLGYAGTWKPWQGTREAIPSLLALAAAVSPCPLRLDLWGDGPCRSEFLSALAVAAGPRVQAVLRGWGSPADLAAARRAWDLAWVPRGPWPPAASSAGVPSADLARAFGEPPPPRFHSPLKEAEALAAGVPLWNGAGAPPLSWDRIAEQILSRIRTLPAPSPPRSRSALLRIWPRAATVGDSGSSAAGDSVRTSEPRAPEGR
jgi:glycosyltransferase involved in cell wall biosynthesis